MLNTGIRLKAWAFSKQLRIPYLCNYGRITSNIEKKKNTSGEWIGLSCEYINILYLRTIIIINYIKYNDLYLYWNNVVSIHSIQNLNDFMISYSLMLYIRILVYFHRIELHYNRKYFIDNNWKEEYLIQDGITNS